MSSSAPCWCTLSTPVVHCYWRFCSSKKYLMWCRILWDLSPTRVLCLPYVKLRRVRVRDADKSRGTKKVCLWVRGAITLRDVTVRRADRGIRNDKLRMKKRVCVCISERGQILGEVRLWDERIGERSESEKGKEDYLEGGRTMRQVNMEESLRGG